MVQIIGSTGGGGGGSSMPTDLGPANFDASLGVSLTDVTNKVPTLLSRVDPYPASYVDRSTVDAAWTSQGVKGLLYTANTGDVLPVLFIPSSATASYTIVFYRFDHNRRKWSKCTGGNGITYVGTQDDIITYPGALLLYPAITAISAGTLEVRYDNTRAGAV